MCVIFYIWFIKPIELFSSYYFHRDIFVLFQQSKIYFIYIWYLLSITIKFLLIELFIYLYFYCNEKFHSSQYRQRKRKKSSFNLTIKPKNLTNKTNTTVQFHGESSSGIIIKKNKRALKKSTIINHLTTIINSRGYKINKITYILKEISFKLKTNHTR